MFLQRCSLPVVGSLLLLICLMLFVDTASAELRAPTGTPHCIETGPGPLPLNDDTFCGCLLGEIFFQGQPLENVTITLTFEDQSMSTVPRYADNYPNPYYSMVGAPLGAVRGDEMTLSVEWNGMTISQTVRAWPDNEKEQYAPIILPDLGAWSATSADGHTRAVAVDDAGTVWAGGTAGVLQLDATRSTSTTHPLPSVRALAVDPQGDVWAMGNDDVWAYDGSAWVTQTVPIAGLFFALVVDDVTGDVWAATYDGADGYIARWDGVAWQAIMSVPTDYVTSLAVDDDGTLWIATWSSGLQRRALDGTVDQWLTVDGLASDSIYDVAVADGTVWAATRASRVGSDILGGVSRFDVTTDSWHTYGAADGLPVNPTDGDLTANIRSIVVHDGRVYVGTHAGVHYLVDEVSGSWGSFSAEYGLAPGTFTDLASGSTLWAASDALSQLDASAIATPPPTATITTASADGQTLTLGASATRNPLATNYQWRSLTDDQLLCSAPDCTLPLDLMQLSAGEHTLGVRVLNTSGTWSDYTTRTVTLSTPTAITLDATHAASSSPAILMLFIVTIASMATVNLLRQRCRAPK